MWDWPPEEIERWQLECLNNQFQRMLPRNAFYRAKLGPHLKLASLADLGQLPFTEKSELVASATESETGISTHHTYSPDTYSRMHRTSGTTGSPLMVLDTEEDWRWWSESWQPVLHSAQVTPQDRVFMAFSFGPFIGFWSAHQACVDRGALVIPGGGLSSIARLEFMRQAKATVVCCTPSYALHLIEVAEVERFRLGELAVDRLIVAGESGGSIPATRARIEHGWQAKVIDHSGATEIGPWGFGLPDRPGLHVNECSFIAELLPLSGVEDPDLYELVLTSLGRIGAPVIRYRTGDAVRAVRPGPEVTCRFLWLPEGIVGRVDNMVTIRGVNVFPSSVDAIVREFEAIVEYRVNVTRDRQLDQLSIEIEGDQSACEQLAKRMMLQLGLRVPVTLVEAGSLPRSEAKSRRWNDQRSHMH